MSALIWFRRDLRLEDQAVVYRALAEHTKVWAVFVFDSRILSALPANDARVSFIIEAIEALRKAIEQQGGYLITEHGDPTQIIPSLAQTLGVEGVYAGEDYEPQATQRDQQIAEQLAQQGRTLWLIKDQVIFAKDEILSQKRTPLTVFTPYKNAWLKRLTPQDFAPFDHTPFQQNWASPAPNRPPSLSIEQIGFQSQPLKQLPSPTQAQRLLSDFLTRIEHYQSARDFPAVKGVSYLSVYLRFGLISIRQLVAEAYMRANEGSAVWLSELIWREFYMQFLWHNPFVTQMTYLPEWRAQPWGNRQDWFEAWCSGRTGYPLIDAAMRQLNQTGYMHNRLRMITAAFLIKDLDIDWRWGEAYFAQKLLDFDLSANNGGWQWAASTGCDSAQPFRIFNPILQSKKFDPEGKFIRRYVPEVSALSATQIHAPWECTVNERQALGLVLGRDYPFPLVDHDQARRHALAKYAQIKAQKLTPTAA